MNRDSLGHVFLRDSLADLWWRRYGIWLYLLACASPILLVHVDAVVPANVLDLLGTIPAIRGLLEASRSQARVVTWLVCSLLAYPLMHLCCRSRVLRNPDQPRWKLLSAVAVFNLVLGGALLVNVVELRGNRLVTVIRSAMLSDGVALAIVGSLISLVYAFVLFMNIHVLLTMFSDPDKETQDGNSGCS